MTGPRSAPELGNNLALILVVALIPLFFTQHTHHLEINLHKKVRTTNTYEGS